MYFGIQSMFYKYSWGVNPRTQLWDHTEVKHVELVCLKRDSAAFQIVIGSEEDLLLTVSEDPLFWKGGPMPIARIELVTDAPMEAEIKIIGLMEDDDRQYKSDPLLEDTSVKVEKNRLQPVWIELHSKENTIPGVYSGRVRLYVHTLFEDERLVEELSFKLTVKDECLPEPQDYQFYLDLWQHNSNIARKYRVELWSDQHFAIMEAYLESLSKLGQKALTVIVSEIPWSGQNSHLDKEPSDFFEYSMVKVRRMKEGSWHYDFRAMDRYIELGEKYGISSEIELFGLLNIWQNEIGYGAIVENYPDGIRVRYYDETAGCYRFIRDGEHLERYIQALAEHLREKEWIERARVLADEPSDFELFRQRVDCLQRLVPSLKFKVAIHQVEFIRKKMKGMHDFVPVLSCAASESKRMEELRGEIEGKLLYYVCCHPDKPNTFLRSPSIESRVIPWLVEKLGYDGFLRWNYTAWPDKPLERIVYRTSIWPAGDTNFVYPGATGKPILSLRYKWLERGIRDYEYMQLLKRTGHAEHVQRVMTEVFKFGQLSEFYAGKTAEELYSFDPADYDALYFGAND